MRLKSAPLPATVLMTASKSEDWTPVAPTGQPFEPGVGSATGDTQSVRLVAVENAVSGSSTVTTSPVCATLDPSNTVRQTLYVPGDSNTCAVTGPIARFLLLTFAPLPLPQVAPPA